MHGKKSSKHKKSPTKGKRKLTRLSASNSNEDKHPVVQDAETSTEEDINDYLDPVGSDTNYGKDLDEAPSVNTSDGSSGKSSLNDSLVSSIIRSALEWMPDSGSLNSVLVPDVHQNDPSIGNVTDILTPTIGSESRKVKFMDLPASRTSSEDINDTAHQIDRPSESQTPVLLSKLNMRTFHEDRFTHMAINMAEKLRLVPDVEQQFLAESLQHIVLAEALAGRLTKEHKLVPTPCCQCTSKIKNE